MKVNKTMQKQALESYFLEIKGIKLPQQRVRVVSDIERL